MCLHCIVGRKRAPTNAAHLKILLLCSTAQLPESASECFLASSLLLGPLCDLKPSSDTRTPHSNEPEAR